MILGRHHAIGAPDGTETTSEAPVSYIPLDHATVRTHKETLGRVPAPGPPNADVYEPVQYSEDLR